MVISPSDGHQRLCDDQNINSVLKSTIFIHQFSESFLMGCFFEIAGDPDEANGN